MAALRAEARTCPRCHLAETRMQVVFGEGSVNARIMVVGQGPGIVEDETGRPFVGPAGALLDRALAEVGLTREQLWITKAGGGDRDRSASSSRLPRDAGRPGPDQEGIQDGGGAEMAP